MPVINANSVDPDQTPRCAMSDLGLHVCQCPIYGALGINGLTLNTGPFLIEGVSRSFLLLS